MGFNMKFVRKAHQHVKTIERGITCSNPICRTQATSAVVTADDPINGRVNFLCQPCWNKGREHIAQKGLEEVWDLCTVLPLGRPSKQADALWYFARAAGRA